MKAHRGRLVAMGGASGAEECFCRIHFHLVWLVTHVYKVTQLIVVIGI